MRKIFTLLLTLCIIMPMNAQKKVSGVKLSPSVTATAKKMHKVKSKLLKRNVMRGQTEGTTITATNLSMGDYTEEYGQFGYSAYNTEKYVELWITTTTGYGTFTESDMDLEYSYVMDQTTEAEAYVETANVTVKEVGGSPVLTGTLTCDDGNTYTLDLSYVKPVKSREETITVQDAELTDYTSDFGLIQIAGYNAAGTRFVSVTATTNQILGSYDMTNLDDYYTYVASMEKGDTTYYDLVEADLLISQKDETTGVVTGTMLCQSESDPADCPLFTLSVTFPMSEGGGEEEGENVLTNGGFETWTNNAQPTGWEGWAATEQSNTGGATLEKTTDAHTGDYACIVKGDSKNKRLSTEKLTLEAGTYNVSFYAKAVGTSAVVKPGYAYLQASGTSMTYDYGDYAQNGAQLTSSWSKVTFSFELTEKTDIALVIMNYKNSGDCIVDDVVLSAGEGGEETGELQYDEESNYNYAFTSADEFVIDEDYFDAYNVLYIDITAEDGNTVSLEFNVDQKDAETVIPVGTYNIDDTYNNGTVTASSGIDSEGYVTYSFAGVMDEEGYIDQIWFLVDGTVTLSKNAQGGLNLVVDAKNSYGYQVKATYTASADGIKNVTTENVQDFYNLQGVKVRRGYKGITVGKNVKILNK